MNALFLARLPQQRTPTSAGTHGRCRPKQPLLSGQASPWSEMEGPLGRHAGNLGAGPSAWRGVQAKLVVGAAADSYEQEADRVAGQVMNRPGSDGSPGVTQAAPSIQRRTNGGHAAGRTPPPIVDRALSGLGQPLDPAARAFFEPRFGHDFGQVRVHADERAAASARAINAHAYTLGHDIVFSRGRYAPQSTEGRTLLAHELTHVVQQTAAPGARVIQREAASESTKDSDSPELLEKLRASHGGQEAKLPLTPEVMEWLDAMRSDDKSPEDAPEPVSDRDPSHFPEKAHPGEAFVWGPADRRAVEINDIKQGYIGDCYFMALLAAIAEVRPGVIEDMVRPNEDGTFTVFLFGPDGKRIEETVEPSFPSYKHSGDPTYAKFGDQSDVFGKELWPMLIEKAWMQHRGGWMKIEGGKTPVVEHAIGMTGAKSDQKNLPNDLDEGKLLARLSEHVKAKQPVTFFSHKKTAAWKEKTKITGVRTNHTYALWNLKQAAKTADLYNPHGPDSDHLLDKSMAFLRTNFRAVVFYTLGGMGPKASAGKATNEEQVATEAIPQEILKGSGYDAIVQEFEKELPGATTHRQARDMVQKHGERLWNRSVERAQKKTGADTDDRPLYWARLRSAAFIRGFVPTAFELSRAEQQILLDVLEAASRGRMDIAFAETKAKGDRRILISGFDPFGFQDRGSRRKGNPAGAAVLALDGKTIPAASGDNKGRVEGVIFPVRFADFDRGMVETTFQPYLGKDPKKAVDMIMTISQGGSTLDPKSAESEQSKAFELERHAGRRRSTPAPDNTGARGFTGGEPVEGKRMGEGPEFLESSLPRKRMSGRKETKEETEKSATPDGKAKEGSGGGYLSNEIFYRTALLRQNEKSSVPVGHLHVPFQPAPTGTPESEKKDVRLRDLIVGWVKKLIARALATLGAKK